MLIQGKGSRYCDINAKFAVAHCSGAPLCNVKYYFRIFNLSNRRWWGRQWR